MISDITNQTPEGEGARAKILQYEKNRAFELRKKGLLQDQDYHIKP